MNSDDYWNTIKSIRAALKIIGVELYSTDRFIADAVAWLAQHTESMEITWDEDSYIVRLKNYNGYHVTSGDGTLQSALAGAVIGTQSNGGQF